MKNQVDDLREDSGLRKEKGPVEKKASAEKAVREIRIVIERSRDEESIGSLCRREGVAKSKCGGARRGSSPECSARIRRL